MYKTMFVDFPGGKEKAFTISYDDGILQDIRFMDLMKKYNIKGTFNFPSSGLTNDNQNKIKQDDAKKLFESDLFEIACHGMYHSFLNTIPTAAAAMELLDDRRELERVFEKPIQGLAYPYGTYDDELIETLKICNFKYARTIKSTFKFGLPDKPLTLHPTCHHNYENLFDLADEFLTKEVWHDSLLFYVWGHTYEFDNDNNWDRIEELFKKVSGNDDIWYCTNIELIDYLEAFNRLECDVDMNYVFNPTIYDISFRSGFRNTTKKYTVKSGELLKIND